MKPEDDEPLLIRSRIRYDPPDENANMASELLAAFRRHARRTLLVDTETGRQWTGADMVDQVGRVATGLVEKVGVRPNNTVMTICDHTGLEILAALGAVLAGASLFGTSAQDGYEESRVLCQLAKPDVIVINSRMHDRALALRQNVAGMAATRIVWIDNPTRLANGQALASECATEENNNIEHAKLGQTDNAHSIESTIARDQVVLFDELIGGPFDEQLIETIAHQRIDARRHVLTYMLTSGSTGRPKVVPSTHEELVHGLYSMLSATKYPLGERVGAGAGPANGASSAHAGPASRPKPSGPLFPLSIDDVMSGNLPLDHGAGLNTMFLALHLGAKFIVMPAHNEDLYWQAVSKHKITMSISSVTFGYQLFLRLKSLIDAHDTAKWDLSSFKWIGCTGAKVTFIDLIREVRRVYPHIQVSQCYGATELGFISMVHRDECDTEYLESTGYLFPGLLAKVVDRDDASKLLGPGERGELLLWANSKFKGYRCHPDDDAQAIYANCHDNQGKFYCTGDQAHYDHEGHIYIHGRYKDTLCLMEDWKILPVELEDVINEHPLVEMSVVVGVSDPSLPPGCHVPKAFVKLVDVESSEFKQLALVDDELSARRANNDLDYISRHIFAFVAERTAGPKHLTGGVRILSEFPRVGLLNKVDRKALSQMD